MKKKLVLLMTLCLMFVLVACNDETDTASNGNETNSTKETVSEATSEGTTQAASETSDTKPDTATEASTASDEETTEATSEESTEPHTTGNTLTVYYKNGSTEVVSERTDGTWSTADGVIYYQGADGILRARGYDMLYTINPTTSGPTDQSGD